jgi:hypothetical protein
VLVNTLGYQGDLRCVSGNSVKDGEEDWGLKLRGNVACVVWSGPGSSAPEEMGPHASLAETCLSMLARIRDTDSGPDPGRMPAVRACVRLSSCCGNLHRGRSLHVILH